MIAVELDWSPSQRLQGTLALVGEELVLTVAWRPEELPLEVAEARMRAGLEQGILRSDSPDLNTFRELLAEGLASWSPP